MSNPNRNRISPQEGLKLFKEAGLLELGSRAREERMRRNTPDQVTFVVDSNPNTTNICEMVVFMAEARVIKHAPEDAG